MRAALVIAVAALLALPAAASAATANVITMLSNGESLGQGAPHEWDPGNSTIKVTGNANDVTVTANDAATGDPYTLEFAGPGTDALKPGIYDGAVRVIARQAAQPGIDITEGSSGCNDDAGRFEVKDIAVDAAGGVSRLWLVY